MGERSTVRGDINEPKLAGIAFLRSDDGELFGKYFSDEEMVEHAWALLVASLEFFVNRSAERGGPLTLGLALPRSVAEEPLAHAFLRGAVEDALDRPDKPRDHGKDLDFAIVLYLTQSRATLEQYALMEGMSPSLALTLLHDRMLSALA